MKQNHNAENAELYSVHPFRAVGLQAGGRWANSSGFSASISSQQRLQIAVETYRQRKFHLVDTGWGQAINDAACLNLSTEAATQVASRAAFK